jgi:hypothetical protein
MLSTTYPGYFLLKCLPEVAAMRIVTQQPVAARCSGLRRMESVRMEFRYGLGFSTTGRARLHIGNQTVTFGWMK